MATGNEVLDWVDRGLPNRFTGEEKARWLGEVEGRIAREVMGLTTEATATETETEAKATETETEAKATETETEATATETETEAKATETETGQGPEGPGPEGPGPVTAWDGIADGDAPLLAPPPYDRLYGLYLMAQVHFYNEEFDRYANARTVANAALDEFARQYRRTHTPARVGGFRGVL